MRLAIIDDIDKERDQALQFFKEYQAAHPVIFTVDSFNCAEAFLKAFVPYTYDIVFMDIYMDGMTGLEAAKKMRQTDRHSLLIFLTSSTDHMGDAFSVHAFDYLSKPLNPERLFACLDDSLKLLPAAEEYLPFSINGVEMRLSFHNIVVLRAYGHSTVLTDISGREYSIYTAFSMLTRPLMEDSRFLLVSRGVLVNMDFISRFTEKTCELSDGLSVPITLRKLKLLEQSWHNYDFAKLQHQAAERNHSL